MGKLRYEQRLTKKSGYRISGPCRELYLQPPRQGGALVCPARRLDIAYQGDIICIDVLCSRKPKRALTILPA